MPLSYHLQSTKLDFKNQIGIQEGWKCSVETQHRELCTSGAGNGKRWRLCHFPGQLLAVLFFPCGNNLTIPVPCRYSEIPWVLPGWQLDRKCRGIPWSQQRDPANSNKLCTRTVHLKRAGGSGCGFLLYPVSWRWPWFLLSQQEALCNILS